MPQTQFTEALQEWYENNVKPDFYFCRHSVRLEMNESTCATDLVNKPLLPPPPSPVTINSSLTSTKITPTTIPNNESSFSYYNN